MTPRIPLPLLIFSCPEQKIKIFLFIMKKKLNTLHIKQPILTLFIAHGTCQKYYALLFSFITNSADATGVEEPEETAKVDSVVLSLAAVIIL